MRCSLCGLGLFEGHQTHDDLAKGWREGDADRLKRRLLNALHSAMATRFSKAPSRSYEPLARRLCKGVYDLLAGKPSQWVSVSQSQQINVKDEEMLNGAISFAAKHGWLMVGGHPVHSVLLTQPGHMAAHKKQ